MTIGYDEQIPERHFTGGAHLTGDQPEDLAPILERMRGNLAIAGATTEDATYYVSTAGDDDEGDGSEGNPFETISRALRDLPRMIRHHINIRIMAGTYTDFPEYLTFEMEDDGQIVIEGLGNPVVAFGPYTLTGYTLDANWTYATFTVAAAGWTPDQFYGKWIRMLTGARAGTVYPIFKNTSDAITVRLIYPWLAPGPTDQFDVVDPPVTVDLDHGVHIHQSSPKPGITQRPSNPAPNLNTSRVALIGMLFKTSATYDRYPFVIVGVDAAVRFLAFQAPSSSVIYPISLHDSNFNWSSLIDPTQVENQALLTGWAGDILAINGTSPGNVTGAWLRNCQLLGLTSRGAVRFDDFVLLLEAAAFSLSNQFQGRVDISALYLDNVGIGTGAGISLAGHTVGTLWQIHVESSGSGHGFEIGNYNVIQMFWITGNPANITGYTARLRLFSRVAVDDGPSPFSGGTGDFIFLSNSTTGTWPANDVIVTDNLAAYVLGY